MADETLSADLELDIGAALGLVDQLGSEVETALGAGAESFASSMADAIGAVPPAEVDVVPVGADSITTDVDAAVAAADGSVPIEGVGAESITGDIDAAVGAADATVQVDADTTGAVDAIGSLSAAVDPIDVPVDVDTSDAVSALDDLSNSATAAGGATSNASAGSRELGASNEYLAAGAGLAVGKTGELQGAAHGLEGGAGAAVGAVGALAVGVGELFHAGVEATSAAQRFNQILGDMAGKVEEVHVGDLNTTITKLGQEMGSTESAMQNATATIFQFATNAGASKQQSADFADNLAALAARAVALNPAIGDVADVATRMEVGLGRARSAAQQFGISISQDEINTRALADTGKSSASELTAYEKSVAGAEVALQRYGNTLSGTVAAGSQNAAIQQRTLKASLTETIEKLGAPLVIPMFDLMHAGIPIAQSFGQVLSVFATNALPAVTQALTAVSGPLHLVAEVMSLIGPAIGPATTAFIAFEAATLILPAVATAVASGLFAMGTAAEGAAVAVDSAAAAMTATPFGLIAAGIAVAASALIEFGGGEDNVTDATKKMTAELAKADGAKLIHSFEGAATMKGLADGIGIAAGRLETFKTIAGENVGVAQRLFDALKAAGEPTVGFQKALDQAAASAKKSAEAQNETDAATTKLTTDTALLAKSTLPELAAGFALTQQASQAGVVAMTDGVAALARYEGGAMTLADTETALKAAQDALPAAVLAGNDAYAASTAAALANKAALDETAASLITSLTPLAGAAEGTRAYAAELAAQSTENTNAASALDRYTSGTLSGVEATKALDDAASALNDELDLLLGRFLTADQATNNYQLALNKLNDDLTKNGFAFDAASTAGAENRNTLDSLAEKASNAADAIQKQTGNTTAAIVPLQNFRTTVQGIRDSLAAQGGDTSFLDAMLGQVDSAIAGVTARSPQMAAAGQAVAAAGAQGGMLTQVDWINLGAFLSGSAVDAATFTSADWAALGAFLSGSGVVGAAFTGQQWTDLGTYLGGLGAAGAGGTAPQWGETGHGLATAGSEGGTTADVDWVALGNYLGSRGHVSLSDTYGGWTGAAIRNARGAADAAGSQAGAMSGAGTGVGQAGASGLDSGLAPMGGIATQQVNQAANEAALAGANMHNIGYGIGAHFIEGIADGANADSGYLSATLAEIVSEGVAAARSAAGIHSPSTVFRDEVGKPIAQGIAIGVAAGAGDVLSETRAVIDGAAAAAVGASRASSPFTPAGLDGVTHGGTTIEFNIEVHGVTDPAQARTVGEQIGNAAVDALTRRGVVTTARLG